MKANWQLQYLTLINGLAKLNRYKFYNMQHGENSCPVN